MKRLLMPDNKTYKGYVIPGEWVAHVPDFFADADYEEALRAALVREMSPAKAAVRAREIIDELGRTTFLKYMNDFLKRHGDAFAKRFPDLIQPDGTLKGFDPEKLQRFFIPKAASPGKMGNAAIKKVLADMAQEARRAA